MRHGYSSLPKGNKKMETARKSLKLLACTWMLLILLGKLEQAAAHEASVKACKELKNTQHWTEIEQSVWDMTCEGKIADLPKNEHNEISSGFLKDIFTFKCYRDRIPSKGVRIKGAIVNNGTLNLSDSSSSVANMAEGFGT